MSVKAKETKSRTTTLDNTTQRIENEASGEIVKQNLEQRADKVEGDTYGRDWLEALSHYERGLILFGIVVSLFWVAFYSRWITEHQLEFFVGCLLSLSLLIVAACQAYIYKRQAHAMRQQSSAIRDQGEVMRQQLSAMENSLRLAQRAEAQVWAVRGFLFAVRAEIRALTKRYEEEDVSALLKIEPGEAFEYHFPIQTQSYFTVYDNGASLLGFVPDDELRRLIVEIYLTARMIIDTHSYNNQLLEERDAALNERPINDTHDRRVLAANAALNAYGHNIRSNYEQATHLVEEFEKRFDSVILKLELIG